MLRESGVVSRKMFRITCHLHHKLTRSVIEKLDIQKVEHATLQSGRMVILKERRKRGLLTRIESLEDIPVDILRFTVPGNAAVSLTNSLVEAARLREPGRGSIFSERIEMVVSEHEDKAELPLDAEYGEVDNVHSVIGSGQNKLMLITCILSLPGSGNTISRLALELGTCVPAVSLALGTGMRDKLGLLRITIPALKEVVQIVVPEHDADGIVRLLVEEGRLNQPGKGFLFMSPVEAGILNTRLRLGLQSHAASIEQIIAAIDAVQGDTAWRRRFPEADLELNTNRSMFVRDRSQLTISWPEGTTYKFIHAATEQGAGGATTERVRILDDGNTAISVAWERTTIIVPQHIVSNVRNAIIQSGLLDSSVSGMLEISPVPRLYSYVNLTRLRNTSGKGRS